MMVAIFVVCVVIALMAAVWAFMAGVRRLDEEWERANRDFMQRMVLEAELQKLKAFYGDKKRAERK